MKLPVNPYAITYARSTAGYKIEDLNQSGPLKRIEIWEAGEDQPNEKQLFEMSKKFGRPVPFFFLNSIPKEINSLVEFRRFMDGIELSFQTRKTIRTAVERVYYFQAIGDMLGIENSPFYLKASLSDDPRQKANEFREALHVDLMAARQAPTAFAAFNYWKQLVEEVGILVFQGDMQELRGFAFIENDQPVVGVSANQSITGRIFSLFHEVGHILLNKASLDDDSAQNILGSQNEVERFCNKFAAEFLMPDELIKILGVGRSEWNEASLQAVSNKFKVSRAALLFRLRELDQIEEMAARQLEVWIYRTPYTKPPGGGGDYYLIQKSRLGKAYAERVLKAFNQSLFSGQQTAKALGIKPGAIRRLEATVFA